MIAFTEYEGSVMKNAAKNIKLVLLPIPGSPLSARFSGPYCVQQALNETDYVVQTPDRRRKTRVCHVNMLKPYRSRVVSPAAVKPKCAAAVAAAAAVTSARR